MNREYIKALIEEVKPATIVAATKYTDINGIKRLISFGIKQIGENRVDDFLEKYDPSLDVKWHFIGHLQRNKLNKIVNKIDVLESLDSLELAHLINEKREKILPCFIELKLSSNPLKSGVTLDELDLFITDVKKLEKIKILGFMAMADKNMTSLERTSLFNKAKELKDKYGFKDLSMGMSCDYKLSLSCGASYVRLGRILFEKEDYLEKYINYYEEK